MTTQQDCTIGMGVETVYGTAVVVSRHFELVSESFDYTPTFLQGAGLRVNQVVPRSQRRSIGKIEAGGDLEIEASTKGMGILLKAALGVSTSTVIAASTGYQHVFTPTTTDYLDSYTIQKGIPPVGGGAILPHTFPGSVCSGFELEVKNSDLLRFKTSWKSRDMLTATAYAAATYPANFSLFSFIQGQIFLGNTLTLPTTTALATATGSAAGNISDFSLKWDNALDEAGFNAGGAGKRTRKPVLGMRSGTGKITAEFDSVVYRDAFINQTRLSILLTFQTGVNAGTSTVPETLQVVIPMVALEGKIPQSAAGSVITVEHDLTILDDGIANAPIYVVLVNTDVTP